MRLWGGKGLGGNQGLVTVMLIAQALWVPNSEPGIMLCIFHAEFFPAHLQGWKFSYLHFSVRKQGL